MNWKLILASYLVIMNVIGFVIMGVDKKKAIKHQYRIPEKTLFLVAILGGSLGGWLGMKRFRHKTKHMKFVVGFSALFLVQTGILIYIMAK